MAVERIGVSLEGPLLADFDRYIAREGYGSRSEALRNLIREALIYGRWEGGGASSPSRVVYRHEVAMVTHRILHRQHEFLASIRATTHSHQRTEVCLEVIVIEGQARAIGELVRRLRGVKGVLTVEPVVAYNGRAR